MSEYAVERARQMFQARQAGQKRQQTRASRRRAEEAEAPPGAVSGGTAAAGEFIRVLHVMHSRLRRLDRWLRDEHHLNLTEMHVLSAIPPAPPSSRAVGRDDAAARLAGEVALSPSGLTRLVDRLVTRGLLARVDDAWDRRVTHLVLTDDGRAVRDAVLPRAVEHIRGGCGEDQLLLEYLNAFAVASADPPRRRARGDL